LRSHAAPAAALVVVGLALAACGGFKAPDLFIVQRSASGAGANLTLLVDEEGNVTCDGAPKPAKLSDSQLLVARGLQEELQTTASNHLSLPARRGSVFSYVLRDENGSVRFADNSAAQPAVLRKLALFVLEVGQRVCRLPVG
jgi:hypothetical protein